MNVAVYSDPWIDLDCIGPARLEWMISKILLDFLVDLGKGWCIDFPSSHPWHVAGATVVPSMSRPFRAFRPCTFSAEWEMCPMC